MTSFGTNSHNQLKLLPRGFAFDNSVGAIQSREYYISLYCTVRFSSINYLC